MRNSIKIRQGVFETNSSSTHSFSISRNEQAFYFPKLNSDQDVLHITLDGEYGWGYDTATDIWTKLDYLLQQVVYQKGIDSIEVKNILNCVKDLCGYLDVTLDTNTSEGYIDHQSIGVISEEEFTDSEWVKNFVFNEGSCLIIDNDNG